MVFTKRNKANVRRLVQTAALLVKTRMSQIMLCCLLGCVLFLASTANASPGNPPPGPYQTTCKDIVMKGTTLVAQCPEEVLNNQMRASALANAASCNGNYTEANGVPHPASIRNVDGALRCVISSKHVDGDHPTDFDIISVGANSIKSRVRTKEWRIDRPEVWSSKPDGEADYPLITFQPGDKISIVGGGCVQTGGFGSQTWKSYINPKGDNANKYYWGTVYIKHVTAGGYERTGQIQNNGPLPALPPDDNAKIDYILRLGYQDDNLSDNGYWNHDDGNNDQCKGIGAAFVVVNIVPGPVSRGPELSQHSKPFDLVWDIKSDEDENGLPLNPQWNFALENQGEQPFFKPLCGAAFPSVFGWNFPVIESKLAEICSSMGPSFDTDPRGAVCDGDPFPGHLNFGIATYQGRVTWEAWSGLAPYDNDWNFRLATPNGAGLAGDGNDPPGPTATIGLEFDFGDVDLLVPFWQDLLEFSPSNAPPSLVANNSGKPASSIGTTFGGPDGEGLESVVIGQVGLDGVHGSYAESHPVFAIAVQLQQTVQSNAVQETWAFFLRNYGDEGSCSTQTWHWDSPTGDYFIQLQWPPGATEVRLIGTNVLPWQTPAAALFVGKIQASRISLIHVQQPQGVDQFGLGGTITLEYTVPGGMKKQPRKVTQQAVRKVPEKPEVNDLSVRIADPAVRAKYIAEMNALAAKYQKPSESKRYAAIVVPLTIAERPHVAGAASRGQLTRARPTPNLIKQQWDAEMMTILQKYQKDLKIELPSVSTASPGQE